MLSYGAATAAFAQTALQTGLTTRSVPISLTMNTGNPFIVGTGSTPLPASLQSELLAYARTSRAILERAKQEALPLAEDESVATLLVALRRMVPPSAQRHNQSELLMRIAANQALELVYGVPTAEGDRIQMPAALAADSNISAKYRILADSVELALIYYPQDEAALSHQNYLRFAIARLQLAKDWVRRIPLLTDQYVFSAKVLEQFLNVVQNEHNVSLARAADAILDVQSKLAEYSAGGFLIVPQDSYEVNRRVRDLRNTTSRLLNDLQPIIAEAAQAQAVAQAATALAAFSIETDVNYYGNDLAPGANVASLAECATQCTANAACSRFTLVPLDRRHSEGPGVCWLKPNVQDAPRNFDQGLVSGSRRQPTEFGSRVTLAFSTDYPLNDIEYRGGIDLVSCGTFCMLNNRCSAFTFRLIDGICWLKSGVSSISNGRRGQGFTSGVVRR